MTVRQAHPVATSVVVAVGSLVVLATAVLLAPLRSWQEHVAGHVALGIPLILLLVLAPCWWPEARPAPAARVARASVVAGLAVAGTATLVEAVAALGYAEDGETRANFLTGIHGLAVAVSPVGLVLLLVGAVIAAGAAWADRFGAAESRAVTVASVVAVLAAGGFLVGSWAFGY